MTGSSTPVLRLVVSSIWCVIVVMVLAMGVCKVPTEEGTYTVCVFGVMAPFGLRCRVHTICWLYMV